MKIITLCLTTLIFLGSCSTNQSDAKEVNVTRNQLILHASDSNRDLGVNEKKQHESVAKMERQFFSCRAHE